MSKTMYRVDVPYKSTYTLFVEAKDKNSAIQQARKQVSVLSSACLEADGHGRGHMDIHWTKAKASGQYVVEE